MRNQTTSKIKFLFAGHFHEKGDDADGDRQAYHSPDDEEIPRQSGETEEEEAEYR